MSKKDELDLVKIKFSNGQEYVGEEEEISLLEVCKKIKAPVAFGCRIGICGTCKVEVSNPLNLSPKNQAEKDFTEGVQQRLACQCYVKGDIDVYQSKDPT